MWLCVHSPLKLVSGGRCVRERVAVGSDNSVRFGQYTDEEGGSNMSDSFLNIYS